MPKRIILFLSGMNANAREAEYVCPDGSVVSGVQTNEAPVKYLLRKYPDIREILCIVTPAAQKTAWGHFTGETREASAGAQLTAIPFSEEEEFAGEPLSQIMKKFQPDDELFLETTGGFRNAVMHLLLLSRVLAYTGVKLSEAVYSNYQTKRIEDVSHLFTMFDLVNGMQELTNLGNVSTLRKYYGGNPEDEKIGALLTAMEDLTESILLCRTKQLDSRMNEFGEALKAAEDCGDPLMRQLLPVFRRKYGKKMNTTSLIKWCVDSDMLQQALTVYTERIPEVILRRGDILQVNDAKISMPEYQDYEDRNAVLFLKRFLTLSYTDPRFRNLDLPQKQIQTIEDLENLLPVPAYQAKRPIENIQVICRDYLYIKNLRNRTNHASGGDGAEPTELLDYLERCGYQNPDSVTMADLRRILITALEHLRPVKKEKNKKGKKP